MHAREILLSKHSLSENKYYFNLYEFLKRRIHALVGKLKNRCFFWFPAASATERDTNMASVSIQSFIKVGKTFFWISRISRRASSPIWASEASLARTQERAAKPRGDPRSRLLARLTSLAQIGDLARRLISHMKYCEDLILCKAFCIIIFFHFPDSRLSVLKKKPPPG